MKLRAARDEETELLSALAFESKAHWGYSAAQLEAWRHNLALSRHLVDSGLTWLAEAEEGVLGFFALEKVLPNWSLEHLWVRPGCMGRGVGRAMLVRALELARQGAASGIAIDADPYAEAFYLACGAIRVGAQAAPIDGAPLRVRPQLLLRLSPSLPLP